MTKPVARGVARQGRRAHTGEDLVAGEHQSGPGFEVRHRGVALVPLGLGDHEGGPGEQGRLDQRQVAGQRTAVHGAPVGVGGVLRHRARAEPGISRARVPSSTSRPPVSATSLRVSLRWAP
ncbi:MAG: hypothetical protein HOY79_40055 [Streptomyces sp.]|nr:hypothetical protein [Streptomyces sp.]